MTVRAALGEVKFSVTATGNASVSLGEVKFAIEASGPIRVPLGIVKFAVRTYPISEVVDPKPPVNITRSQAPFVRRWN